ncbi:MAG: hypothetical protein ACIAXF_06810 [Phycisphaerales bacterium JB063]
MSDPQSPTPPPSPGPNSPEEIIFDDNLQEFATKVGHICALETSGKLPPGEAYQRIRSLWKLLKTSKKNLRIGKDTP